MTRWGFSTSSAFCSALLLLGACDRGDRGDRRDRRAHKGTPAERTKAGRSERAPDPGLPRPAAKIGRVVAGGADSFAALGPAATEAALRIRFPAPAGQAPITVTERHGSDPDTSKYAVRLVELRARAAVQGPLAFTELHLVLDNPRNREVDTWLRVRLPPRAAVSRLAMLLPGGWEEAEVVERFRARDVCENLFSKRIDPSLVEKDDDDSIGLRVFPIVAKGRKEVKIAWSEDLPSSQTPYRLRLKGLGTLEKLDARVLVSEPGGASPRVMQVAMTQAAPDADLVADGDPRPAMVGVRSGALAVARVTTPAPGRPLPLASLLVLVDSSALMAGSFHQAVDRASALVQALGRKYGKGLGLRVAAYDQSVGVVYHGPAGGFGADALRALRARFPLGRADLENALAWAAEQRDVDRVLLLSSLIPVAGAEEPASLASAVKRLGPRIRRLDVALVPHLGDPTLATWLVRGHLAEDGVVLGDDELPQECARRLSSPVRYDVPVTVPGAKWSWPTRVHRHQAGDDLLVFASLDGDKQGTLAIRVGEQAAGEVRLDAAHETLVRRAWAGARIAELDGQLARRPAAASDTVSAEQREIARLSQEHRVLSSQTGLLMLETDEDYKRHAISRTALPNVLTVGDAGLVLVKRRGAVTPGASKTPASDKSPSVLLRAPSGEPAGFPTLSRSVPTFGGWGGFGQGGGGGCGSGIGLGGGGLFGRYREYETNVFTSRADVQGGLDAETIRRVVRRHLIEIKYCYVSLGLPKTPRLEGMVKVRFTLTPYGVVESAAVARTTLNHELVEQCILSAVRRWRFPKPEGSQPIVVYPFHMKPGALITVGTLAEAKRVGWWHGDLAKLVQPGGREAAVAAIPSALAKLADQGWNRTNLMILGRLAATGGAPALAARIYGTVIENPWPIHRDPWLGAALLETLGGDWARHAAEWYRDDSPRYAKGASAWAQTLALLRQGRPAEALDAFNRPRYTRSAGPPYVKLTVGWLEPLGLLAGLLVQRAPDQRAALEKRLTEHHATLPSMPMALVLMVGGGAGCSPALVVQDGKDRTSQRNLEHRDAAGAFGPSLSFGNSRIEIYRIGDVPGAYPYHLRVGCLEHAGSPIDSLWYIGRIDVLQVTSQGKVLHSSTPFFGNERKVAPLVTTVTVSP